MSLTAVSSIDKNVLSVDVPKSGNNLMLLMSSLASMKSNSAEGLVVDGVPPDSLCDRGGGLDATFCNTNPLGTMPDTLTTSLNMRVRTPVLALKVNAISSGLCVSGPTKEACRALDSVTGSRKLPATSAKALDPSTMYVSFSLVARLGTAFRLFRSPLMMRIWME